MPHAALWVVQHMALRATRNFVRVSMPHAALWVVQPYPSLRRDQRLEVSMPHAALWVVQRYRARLGSEEVPRFNAARGFVGGATTGDLDW